MSTNLAETANERHFNKSISLFERQKKKVKAKSSDGRAEELRRKVDGRMCLLHALRRGLQLVVPAKDVAPFLAIRVWRRLAEDRDEVRRADHAAQARRVALDVVPCDRDFVS